MSTYRKPSIVIVGAGYPEIVAAAELHRHGYRVTVIDQRSAVGARWESTPLSWPVHESVRRPRQALAHRGSPLTTPSGGDVAKALGRYAAESGLTGSLLLNTQASHAEFDDDAAGWRTYTTTGHCFVSDVLVTSPACLASTGAATRRALAAYDGPVTDRTSALSLADARTVAVIGPSGETARAAVYLANTGRRVKLFNAESPQLRPSASPSSRFRAGLTRKSVLLTALERNRLLRDLGGTADTILVPAESPWKPLEVIGAAITDSTTGAVIDARGTKHDVDAVVTSPDIAGAMSITLGGERTARPVHHGMALAGVPNLMLMNGYPRADWMGLEMLAWEAQANLVRLATRRLEILGRGRLTLSDVPRSDESQTFIDYLDAIEQLKEGDYSFEPAPDPARLVT